MTIDVDITKILISVGTSIIIAIIMYIGTTVHHLDKNHAIMDYKIEQINSVLQDLYEEKKDR